MTVGARSWLREATSVSPRRDAGMRDQDRKAGTMRRTAMLLSGVLLLLAAPACGGDSDSGDDGLAPPDAAGGPAEPGGDDSATSDGATAAGAEGTLWGVTNTLALAGVDLATGDEVLPPSLEQVVEPLTPV